MTGKGLLYDGNGKRLYLLTLAEIAEIVYLSFAGMCFGFGIAFMILHDNSAMVMLISSIGYSLCAIAARFAGGFKNG